MQNNSLEENSSLNKAPIKKRRLIFTKEEDSRLTKAVEKYGEDNWELVSSYVGNRTRRQCSERWRKFLSPTVNLSKWTEEEDKLLIEKFKEIGPKWSQISHFFNNRTDVNIKARFVVLQRKAKKHQEFIEKVKLFSNATKKFKTLIKPQNNITTNPADTNNNDINTIVNTDDSENNLPNKVIDIIYDDQKFTYNRDIYHKKELKEIKIPDSNCILIDDEEEKQNLNENSFFDGQRSAKSIFDDNFDFKKFIKGDSSNGCSHGKSFKDDIFTLL